MQWQWVRSTVLISLTGASLAVGQMAAAQDVAQNGEQPALELEGLQVVGSRLPGRSAEDSPVPVDIIDGDSFKNYGVRDLNSLLSATIPSYNVNPQITSDVATAVRPAKLRGLPPDSTLILVNGKRRHRSAAIVDWDWGSMEGSHLTDIASIPAIALKRVEVLRDGASAQYGSDAVAGVLNFVLRDDPEGGTLEARWGQHYHGDGDLWNLAGNVGLPLTEAGFANFSFEYTEADRTDRSVQTDAARALVEAGNAQVQRPTAQSWGHAGLNYDYKFFGNLGLNLTDNHELYAFGNYAEREVEDSWYFRVPSGPNAVGGIFSNDGETLLVADLSDDGQSGNCPTVPFTDLLPDQAALDQLAGNPDCFSFYQRFPGGFTPRHIATATDWSVSFGLRGTLSDPDRRFVDGWRYDMSASFGRNRIGNIVTPSINPQLAHLRLAIPTEYFSRAYAEFDKVFNLDLSRPFDIGLFASPLNVALGLEYREEEFEIIAGEPNAYAVDERLVRQGFSVGVSGYQGIRPENAGSFERGSFGAYLDFEANALANVLLNAAGRYEHYEGVGDSLNGKLAARWDVFGGGWGETSPMKMVNLALRGSINTSFRAPTVGQIHYRNVTTFPSGGQLLSQALLPADHPVAKLKGIDPLKPEHSTTFAVGAVVSLGELSVTLDYYNTEVRKRISATSAQTVTEAEREFLIASGRSDLTNLQRVLFFANYFDSTTQGLDLVATYPLEGLGGTTFLTFVGNWNDTQIDTFNPRFVDPAVKLRQLEDALPEFRFSLMADHFRGPWRFLTRLHYYDAFTTVHELVAEQLIRSQARLLVDLEASYTLGSGLTLAAGAQNLFDTYPTRNPYRRSGAKYSALSPYGFSGGLYYLRASYAF